MSVLPSFFAALFALAPLAYPQENLNDRRRTPVVEVVERVKPAVVSITTNVRGQVWPVGLVEAEGPSGTGVVIYEDGLIITNYHVVKDASQIQVRFDASDDEHVYDAVLVSGKPKEDLALLKIEGEEPFHTVTMCESDPILGETAIAIGNAFGHSHTVSTGIVSGLHRNIGTSDGLQFDNLLQTDASINPGNSGGPLLNINGELIGINSAMQNMAENIGFAIPVSHVRKVLFEQLLALSEARAWLGFDVDENTLQVQSVSAGGPAALAGVAVGDRLSALNGHLLTALEGEVRDVYRRVRIAIQPLATVALSVKRGKREEQLELRAWNKVDGMLFEHLGLTLETVHIGHRGGNAYLRVTQVQPDGPAASAGLAVDDVLTTVQRKGGRETWFQRPEDLAGVALRLPAGTELTVEIWRDTDGDGVYFERDVESNYSEHYKGTLSVR
ncbi:MAG: trypsin-like serine protease [Planctomycetes bacterium]|nr:trypsin-like serine protease [Planctomycetota bacterium]